MKVKLIQKIREGELMKKQIKAMQDEELRNEEKKKVKQKDKKRRKTKKEQKIKK